MDAEWGTARCRQDRWGSLQVVCAPLQWRCRTAARPDQVTSTTTLAQRMLRCCGVAPGTRRPKRKFQLHEQRAATCGRSLFPAPPLPPSAAPLLRACWHQQAPPQVDTCAWRPQPRQAASLQPWRSSTPPSMRWSRCGARRGAAGRAGGGARASQKGGFGAAACRQPGAAPSNPGQRVGRRGCRTAAPGAAIWSVRRTLGPRGWPHAGGPACSLTARALGQRALAAAPSSKSLPLAPASPARFHALASATVCLSKLHPDACLRSPAPL
jgi:hypothetical protein